MWRSVVLQTYINVEEKFTASINRVYKLTPNCSVLYIYRDLLYRMKITSPSTVSAVRFLVKSKFKVLYNVYPETFTFRDTFKWPKVAIDWNIYVSWSVAYRGGDGLGVQPPPIPEIPKAPQNRAKLNPILKNLKNC